MQTALTQKGVSPALATLVTLEMESTVQVSSIVAFLERKELARVMKWMYVFVQSIAIRMYASSSNACLFLSCIYSFNL